ncbi:dihydropteroate synthase [Ruficoccus sp. ZRK36]|uniref:dihydropteroate synthase n=1 Tax=Ruficoccus sp. ZRK36 TaxID=2866311 RepID=UPI001C73D6B1|nr:dihydropteroate synthase [Ruficoccus sp. ZRK36]QYY36972.1 dihydropteroate synthase [Ruficoccus sp. ZRK36]
MTALTTTWRSPHGRALPPVGGRTLMMGILNVTPDSFSDGGKFQGADEALRQAERLVAEGADVIDIGGESTRPGHAPVTAAEEAARVLPVVRLVREAFPDLALSVDTYKAEVAEAAVEAGADMINDVWGFRYGLDPKEWARWTAALRAGAGTEGFPLPPMAIAAARLECPVILMHNRPEPVYADFWADLLDDLRVSLAMAEAAGVQPHQRWLDPGFGFGKGPAHNLETLRGLDRVCGLGCPVLLGTSRKSTIGLVLGREVDAREEGTQVTLVWGVAKGCHMVRVHDVARARHTLQMADAIAEGLHFDIEKARQSASGNS